MRLRTVIVVFIGLCVLGLAWRYVLDVIGPFRSLSEAWYVGFFGAGGVGVLTLGVNFARERKQYPGLMVLGLLVAPIAIAALTVAVIVGEFGYQFTWLGFSKWELVAFLVMTFATCLSVVALAAQWGLLAMLSLQWTVCRWLRLATRWAGLVCVVTLSAFVWDEWVETGFGRWLGRYDLDEAMMVLTSVAALAGTALVPLAAILESMLGLQEFVWVIGVDSRGDWGLRRQPPDPRLPPEGLGRCGHGVVSCGDARQSPV